MVDERALTPNERAVLLHVLKSKQFPCSDELVAQVDGATVAGGLPMLLDLRTDSSSPAATCADGPTPVRAFVEGPDGTLKGEVMVWVKNGRLSGLEYAWYTDEQPDQFPDPAQIRLEPA
jgi:hypothetical protein